MVPLLFTPEPCTYCGAAEDHDSDSSLDFAKRIFMSVLPVAGYEMNRGEAVTLKTPGYRGLLLFALFHKKHGARRANVLYWGLEFEQKEC